MYVYINQRVRNQQYVLIITMLYSMHSQSIDTNKINFEKADKFKYYFDF